MYNSILTIVKITMPTIYINNIYKLNLVHNYIEKNIKTCKHTIDIYSIDINHDNSSKLSMSYESKEFLWHDDNTVFKMYYSKEGKPCPRENIYYKYFWVSHDNLTILENFVRKILTSNFKLSINVGSSHGYWDSIEVKNPSVNRMSNLFLPSNIIDKLCNQIEYFNKPETMNMYVMRGDTYKRVFLLEGIPGSGKSTLIKAVGCKYQRNIYYLNFSQKIVDDVLLMLMNRVLENSILVIEDIDSYFNEDGQCNNNINVSMPILLNILDGANDECFHNVLIFLTANDINKLDSRLKRPGRINTIFKFDYPERAEIERCFKHYATPCDDINEKFKEFYNKIKYIKICMSGIKWYIIEHSDDYLDHIDDLEKDLISRNTKTNTDKMFI